MRNELRFTQRQCLRERPRNVRGKPETGKKSVESSSASWKRLWRAGIQAASSCAGATERHWLLCKTAWGWESLGSRDTRSDWGRVRVRYDRPPPPPPLRTNVTTSQSKSLEHVLQTVMPPLCTLEPPFTAVCSVGFSNLTFQVVTSSGSFVSHWVGAVARDWWSWLFSHRELLAVSSFLNLRFYFLYMKRSLVLVNSTHIKFKSLLSEFDF